MMPGADPIIDDLAVAACERRAELEAEAVRVILSDPAEGIKAAQKIGLTIDLFDVRQDVRLMYAAAEAAGARGRLPVLELIVGGLQAEGFWDERETATRDPWFRCCLWSLPKLCAFAGSWCTWWSPLSPGYLREVTAKLVRMHQDLRDARDYMRRAVRLMEGCAA